MRWLVFGIAACLALTTAAATIADRSRLAQGVWWNPATSGSGFEIFTHRDDVALFWYTYDAAGKPTWYLAQGSLNADPTQYWPLLSHRWVDGKHGEPVVAGHVRLRIHNPEFAEVEWKVGSTSGKWPIQPFVLAGVINDPDHSGAWFNPANSGWGLSLVEQGNILSGVLYGYDPQGMPIWYSGHDRGSGGINLFLFNGACPGCLYRAPTHRSVGRLELDFRSETELTLRSGLGESMASGINLHNAPLVQLSRPASSRPADRQLAQFTTAEVLKQYLSTAMLGAQLYSQNSIPFSASPAPAASAVAPAFSATNLQEADVDEADVIKSDGKEIFTFAHDHIGVRLDRLRVAAVAAEGTSMALRGEIMLRGGSPNSLASAGLYVTDTRIVAISGTTPPPPTFPGTVLWNYPVAWRGGKTHVEILDRSKAGLPATIWDARIDGHLVTSRRIGDRLIVITRHTPDLPGFSYGATSGSQFIGNQNLLATTPLATLLPKVVINAGVPQPLLAATDVYSPPQGARKIAPDIMTVTVIDLAQAGIRQSLGILGSVDTVYASSSNLYLVGSRNEYLSNRLGAALPEPASYLTDLHQIRLTGESLAIAGSATVEGYVDSNGYNASFRLGEHDGRLRIVTSSSNMWGTATKNRLTILEPSPLTPGLLRTVAILPNDKRPETLGKPGERLYGTRFLGDRLYAVTFLRVDPLYVVDLSDHRDPKITGALEIPGFSDYLHPLPNGLLLGFGMDARPTSSIGDGQFAWFQGLQLSLFDTSDAGKPRELQRLLMGRRGSQSALLSSHHAFSALQQPDGSLDIGIPAAIHGSTPPVPGTSDNTFHAWDHTGLLRFQLRGTSATDARLEQRSTLVTHRASFASPARSADSIGTEARSVLFPNGAVYVNQGRFWHQGTSGLVVGPL